jgi:2-polyprenyl-6-methoxyphenol hydroxylase-like FAD-dependent oxidoreductase
LRTATCWRKYLGKGVNSEALRAYETERLERTTRIVNQSRQFGIPVSWTNPLAVWLRDKLLEFSPPFLTEKLFRENICYDVGDLKKKL